MCVCGLKLQENHRKLEAWKSGQRAAVQCWEDKVRNSSPIKLEGEH